MSRTQQEASHELIVGSVVATADFNIGRWGHTTLPEEVMGVKFIAVSTPDEFN